MPDQWPYEQITDHAETALSRYTHQYSEAETLHALTTLWAERMQALEDAAWSVLTQRWIPVAAGVQLDEMGELVGEPRLGRTDEPYRDALAIRIIINRSGGEPELILEFLTRIAGASQVLYQEIWPAKIEMFVGGNVSPGQIQRVRDIVPAAIGTLYVTETGGEKPFGTSETMDGPALVSGGSLSTSVVLTRSSPATYWGADGDDPPAVFQNRSNPTDVDGFGELGIHEWELDTGDVLEFSVGGEVFDAGLTDKDDPILPDPGVGGIIAELFEV